MPVMTAVACGLTWGLFILMAVSAAWPRDDDL